MRSLRLASLLLVLTALAWASAPGQTEPVPRHPTTKVLRDWLTIGLPLVRSDITTLTGGGPTALDGQPTAGAAGLRTGAVVQLVIEGQSQFWRLEAGTSEEDGESIVRPDDYHASTNARIWVNISPAGGGAGEGDITAVVAGDGLTGGASSGSATLNVGAGTGIVVAADAVAVIYGTTAGTAAEGNDSRLADARTPTGAAGGALTGTYPNPTVANNAVALGTQTTGNYVATLADAGGGEITVTGSGSESAAVQVALGAVPLTKLAQGGATSGQVLAWDGEQYAPTTISVDGANDGWSPEFAVASDGARRVLQVVDWTGGEGTKPTTGLYVGATGLTATIGDAVDIRGPAGETGAAGEAGEAGAAGEDAYVYIAYASDASGTGFTLTFDADLDYIAILATDTEIPSPSAGDFSGLWKNYRGPPGESGEGTGDLLAANNLSDVANAATAFGNIKQAATTNATGVVELATDGEDASGVVVQGNDSRLAGNAKVGAANSFAERQTFVDTARTAYATESGAAVGAAVTIDAGNGDYQTVILDEACTVTLVAPAALEVLLRVKFVQDDPGGNTVALAGGATYYSSDGATITSIGGIATAADATTLVGFHTDDGGATWTVYQPGGALYLALAALGSGVATALGEDADSAGGLVTSDGVGTLEGKSLAIDIAADGLADDGAHAHKVLTGRNAGATIAQWEVVVLRAGVWELADQDAGTLHAGLIGLAMTTGSDGNPLTVLIEGFVRNDTWAWTADQELFLSATPGAMTATAPTTNDHIVRKLAVAITDDEIYFQGGVSTWGTVVAE